MGYPVAYRGGLSEPRKPRPLTPRVPSQRPRQPRPANDNFPKPANDNFRIQGGSRRVNFTRFMQHYQLAKGVVNAVRFIVSRNVVRDPPLDGYVLTLSCSGGGGPWNHLAGFPSCAGPFVISPSAMANGGLDGSPARPPVIYKWGPYSHDHPSGGQYYFPGQRWTRVVTAGKPQIVTTQKQIIVREPYTYQVPFWKPFTAPGFEPEVLPWPWRAIPQRRPSGLPEDGERGNGPRPAAPASPDWLPGPGTTFIFRPGNRPVTRPPVQPGTDPGTGTNPRPKPRRVRKREKEKKRFAKISGVPARIVSAVTETADVIDALYEALPKHIRTKLWRAEYYKNKGTDQFTTLSPQDKAWYIYKYWKHLDLDQALVNIGLNQIEDFLIGQASSRTRKRHREAGGLTGFFAGPTL